MTVWLKDAATDEAMERLVNEFQNNNNIQSVFGAIIDIVNEIWSLVSLRSCMVGISVSIIIK